MASSVHIKEAVVITPAEPTPSRILTLSSLDSQLFLRFTIEYLFIYNPLPHNLDQQLSLSSRLKSSLSKLLVPYYPLSGRLRQKPDSSGLEILCRSQGALFLEAVSDYYSSTDFDRAPRFVSEWRKLLSFNVIDVLDGSPPLIVQLTWLKDGAAALGFGFNHCFCDGIGSADFLNSFAELASGKYGTVDFINPQPIWDRHVLTPRPRPRPRSITLLPEFNRIPDLSGFTSRFTNEPLIPTSITFGKSNLNNLKLHAQSSSFTSFEVLSAHIWRSWARSLKLPSNQTVKLLFSVNIRKRMKSNIPNGYYGNAFVLGCAQTSVKELMEKGLNYGSGLVKKAKERVGDEYVRKVVEFLSESRGACPDSVGVLIISQWSRLGLEKVDFGLGKPVQVNPVCCDRYCILLPVFNQTDAVKVMVAVPTSAVHVFQSLLRNAAL